MTEQGAPAPAPVAPRADQRATAAGACGWPRPQPAPRRTTPPVACERRRRGTRQGRLGQGQGRRRPGGHGQRLGRPGTRCSRANRPARAAPGARGRRLRLPSASASAAHAGREEGQLSPFDTASRAYRAGRFDDATRLFDSLAAADANAELGRPGAVREGKGCRNALARFDNVARRAAGTPPGWDALLEGRPLLPRASVIRRGAAFA